jgi:anti-sigma B factor antagonist
MEDFGITAHRVEGWDVLTVSGELDAHTGPVLRAAIVDVLAHQHALVIDMTGLGFLDSSGLGVLVSALRRIRSVGGDLKLVIDSETIRKLMRLTALDLVFDISPTLAEATATAPTAVAATTADKQL